MENLYINSQYIYQFYYYLTCKLGCSLKKKSEIDDTKILDF